LEWVGFTFNLGRLSFLQGLSFNSNLRHFYFVEGVYLRMVRIIVAVSHYCSIYAIGLVGLAYRLSIEKRDWDDESFR
jgi:hypothetical protein